MENEKETTENTEIKSENVTDGNTENQITKKKSPVLFIIIAAVLAIAAVIVYFTFFSTAVVRNREIKAHIVNAEKYLEDKDYENAIAEYEAILKLDPKADGVLNDYVDTVLAYTDETGAEDPDKAKDILANAISFLEKLDGEDGSYDAYISKLKEEQDKYEKEIIDEAEESEAEEDTAEEIPEEIVINYTVKEIDIDSIGGDGWNEKFLSFGETIVCSKYTEYVDDPSVVGGYELNLGFYDMDGTLLNEVSFGNPYTPYDVSEENDFVTTWGWNYFKPNNGNIGVVVYLNHGSGHSWEIYLYDNKGNFIKKYGGYIIPDDDFTGTIDAISLYLINDCEYSFELCPLRTNNDNYIAIKDTWYDASEPVLYIDCNTLELKYPSEVEGQLETSSDIEYDESVFSYCEKEQTDNSEIAYFVGTADGKWGYTDENFNTIALYEDASAFNADGFALVSDDRENYSLIDCNFNVIEENIVKGQNAYLRSKGSNIFVVTDGDETHYYLITAE